MDTRMWNRYRLVIIGAALSGAIACNQRDAEPGATATKNPTAAPAATAAAATPGWITTKIQSQYFANPEIKPWNIDVTTSSRGVVTLRGELDREADRAEAVRIAQQTDGVTRVNDLLRVKGAGESVATTGTESATQPSGRDTDSGLEPPDLWITTKVQAKYFMDDEVRGRSIDVDTQGGVVTLRGTVDSYAARRQAVALARNTEGVREVRDELQVNESATADAGRAEPGSVDPVWVETKIQAKYFLDPDVKGHNIDVEVADGVVTLTGTVESESEKQTAEQIARETDGVKDVRNQVLVRAEAGAQP